MRLLSLIVTTALLLSATLVGAIPAAAAPAAPSNGGQPAACPTGRAGLAESRPDRSAEAEAPSARTVER